MILALSLFGRGLHAQSTSVSPEDEYKQRIRVSETVQPLGESPFGENIGLYDGSLSFEQTDINFAGNGPPLQLIRSFKIPDISPQVAFHAFHSNALVDWSLETPHIETLSAPEKNVDSSGIVSYTWFFLDDYYGTERCSGIGQAPTMYVSLPGSVATYSPDAWWHGYQLMIPGMGSQDLLARDASNTLTPQMTAADGSAIPFPIVTRQHWAVGCLPQTANGQPGQGFLAVSPDGTRYWLDWLAYKSADAVAGQAGGALKRRVMMLLASKVVDRFGNSLAYSYDGDGNLTSIQASDGRQLTLSYDQWQAPTSDPGPSTAPPTSYTSYRLRSATLQPSSGAPRTWTYTYGSDPSLPRLTGVQLPDGSAWSFNMGGLLPANAFATQPLADYEGCEYTPHPDQGVSSSATLVHPSGLIGTFTVHTTLRGRSYVPKVCLDNTGSYLLRFPHAYAEAAIQQKSYSGAGMPTQTWTYAYSPANESWDTDCASGCAATVWTDVTDPAGHSIRYTFSNRFDASESQLLGTTYYSGAVGTAVARSENDAYASPGAGSWPATLGSPMQVTVNTAQLGALSPLNSRTLSQDGDSYVWQAEDFDAFAQPTKVRRSNSIAGQSPIEEQTSFLNDLPHWVLGLPQEVDNLSTGEVESANAYDLSNVTLQSRSRFGQVLMRYTYDAQGNLASFTDGNDHTTALGSYKLGIPQAIGYPDGTSQQVAVDDFGQIASITDQAGNTTSYSYNAVGRLTRIDYPVGDEVAWLPRTYAYDYVGDAERGIAGGHWRRTMVHGNAVTATYYDALLRPVLSDTYISGNAGSHSNVRTDYDWQGQKTFVSYPAGGSPDVAGLGTGTHTSYDALERPVSSQQDSELGLLTTTTAYPGGAREQVTDPEGHVTTTTYQVFDQPADQAPVLVQAPEGVTQAVVRDLYGSPLSITQSGLYGTESDSVTKTLIYDAYHRLCRSAEPESGSEVLAYDGANNLVWSAAGLAISGSGCGQEQVADEARTVRTYDPMNRLLTLAPPSGTQSTVYTYDALGNEASAQSGITLWQAHRNKLNLLTSETLSVDGQDPWAIGYGYDAYGNLASIQYPGPGTERVDYVPDALGRPTQVGSYASEVSYYPDGVVEGYTLGNGTTYLAQENARQNLSNFSYGLGSTLQLSEDLTYDADGNISQMTDLAGGPRSKSFGYDGLNRLTSAQANGLWGSESYGYDPLNNLRSRVTGGQGYAYNYDAANHLASITSGGTAVNTFGYDSRGNVVDKDGVSLVFDQKNQLNQVMGYDSYDYDAEGRRVRKMPSNGGAPTYYFYSQAGQLMYQYDPATTLATNYVYLGKKLLARNAGPASVVIGNIDGVSVDDSGAAGVAGWACSKGLTQSISVDLYVGGPAGTGTGIGRYTANQSSEAAVQSACGVDTGSYRFLIPLSEAVRSQYAGQGIYVHGISPVGGSNNLLSNSGSFTVPAAADVPAPPSVVTASVSTDLATLTVSWGAVADASSYVVQQQINAGAWTTVAADTGTPGYSVSNPADGSYTYRVQACNGTGCSAAVISNTVSVAHIPATPASISVPGSSTTGSYTVSWVAVAYATSYTLEQNANGAGWTQVYSGAGTSAAISVGTGSYSYRVAACNANGCGGYATSGAVQVTLPPAAAPALSVPGSSSTGSYTVTWTGVAGATSYTLQEQANGGGWATVQADGTGSWVASGRGDGVYGYQVQACNAGGCGPWSGVGSITVRLIPAAPASPSVAWTSNPYTKPIITVSWAPVASATSYTVEETLPANPPQNVYTGPNTSFSKLTLANGVVRYRVMACNANGCSAWGGYGSISLLSGG